MFARDYEVWHTFGTYFTSDFEDGLKSVAERLVQAGVAAVAYTSDGFAYAKREGKTVSTECAVRISPSGQLADIRCDLLEPHLYSGEGVYQFAWMAYRESWLMSGYLREYAPFARALLNPILLEDGKQSVVLYPQLKIYGNGVMLLHLRLFSPDDGSDGETLVDKHLNLFEMDVERLGVPPEVLMQYDAGAALTSMPSRQHTKKAVAAFERHIRGHVERAHRLETEDFTFTLVDIPPDYYALEGEPPTLGFVRELLTMAVARVLASPRQVHRDIGGYWSSRPTVFLFDYDRQPERFEEDDPILDRDFASIMLRVPDASAQVAERTPLDNLRVFDDCRWFVGEAVNLLAFSKEGAQANQEYADPNHGQLVYDKMVQVEAMEFIRYTHRRMLENAMKPKGSPEETQADWRAASDMEQVVSSPSNLGEVTDTIHYYSKVTGLDDVRRRIVQSIEMQGQYAAYRRNQSLTALGVIATIVLGLSAVPTLTSEVTLPLLQLFGLIVAPEQTGTRLGLMLGTTVVLGFILLAIWWLVGGRDQRTSRT